MRLKVRDGDWSWGRGVTGQRKGLGGDPRLSGNNEKKSILQSELGIAFSSPKRDAGGGREGFSGMKACGCKHFHRDVGLTERGVVRTAIKTRRPPRWDQGG